MLHWYPSICRFLLGTLFLGRHRALVALFYTCNLSTGGGWSRSVGSSLPRGRFGFHREKIPFRKEKTSLSNRRLERTRSTSRTWVQLHLEGAFGEGSGILLLESLSSRVGCNWMCRVCFSPHMEGLSNLPETAPPAARSLLRMSRRGRSHLTGLSSAATRNRNGAVRSGSVFLSKGNCVSNRLEVGSGSMLR